MISKLILKLMGWKIKAPLPNADKAIVIVAPHTSMMDFVLGRLFFNVARRRVYFLIKKELFFFPLGYILKAMGAVPVARGQKNNMVDTLVELFNKKKRMILVITPEGTRKKTAHWKRGFYHIAASAKVPIIIGALDYKLKIIDPGFIFTPTGNIEEDMKTIKLRYKNVTARHPEKFTIGNIEP